MTRIKNGIASDESRIAGLQKEVTDHKNEVTDHKKEVTNLHWTNAQVSSSLALATTKVTTATSYRRRHTTATSCLED